MKLRLLCLTCAYLFACSPTFLSAAIIDASPTGLSFPTNQVTFDAAPGISGTPLDQIGFSELYFSYGLYLLVGEAAEYGLSGKFATNTWGFSTTQFSIFFNNEVSDAAFVMKANAGDLNLSALMDGVVAEMFSTPSNGDPTVTYYGFRDISFNEIRITSSNAGVIAFDDIQFNVASIPLPPALYLFGTGLLGLVGLARRKVA